MKKLFIIVMLLGLLSLVGCVQSAYILKESYTNPKSGKVETISVPVSQYVYENTPVGATSEVTIHTSALGIRVPVADGLNPKVQVADLSPLIMSALGLIALVFTKINKKRDYIWLGLSLILIFGFVACNNSLMQPDFTATATVIDKNFVISGY